MTVADRVEQLYRGEKITMDKSEQWYCAECREMHLAEFTHKPPGAPRWPDTDETSKGYREFKTGASRDTAIGKLDVARYIHPLVIKRFAEYMLEKQDMPDGTTRTGDNWQKGIPPQELMSSLGRHHLDIWLHMKNESTEAQEPLDRALLGALFNIMALILHEERGTIANQ